MIRIISKRSESTREHRIYSLGLSLLDHLQNVSFILELEAD
jgi:hypothetical protein